MAQAYFEIWANKVGIEVKNNSSVDWRLYILFTCTLIYTFYHVISD